MRRLLLYLTVLLTAVACSSIKEDELLVGMDPSLEGKPVTVTFSVPGDCLLPSTKSLESGDGLITGTPYLDPNKLYLVVCGHSQSIKYIRKAELVSQEQVSVADIPDYPITDGAEEVTLYKFNVQLELSDSDRTIHFLGNIDESQLNTGSYSYQTLPTLLSYEGKQAYWQKVYLEHIHPELENNSPVMQGGSYLPDEYTKARLSYIPLIRNYAEILVVDKTDPDDGFELYSYSVIYYPKRGSVVPYRSNVSSGEDPFNFGVPADSRLSGYEKCGFYTLEDDLQYFGNIAVNVDFDRVIPNDSMFANPETSDGRVIRYDKNKPDKGFYLFERTIPNENLDPTFVIIRGKFQDSDEYYYYRLDLMETKVVDYESVYQYYPIYRNFRYEIQLNRISSIGVSSPEAAANSSGAEDISADISMRHLGDISNGITRLVVEPFMSKTYTGPNEEGYYYLYARFYNDLNSPEPNTDWGAVTVELEPMDDGSDDILVLYNDVGHEVYSFYPSAQELGGEPGFRVIRFNTKVAGNETKTQKIKITGRNLYSHETYPLYREVEITLQKKQNLIVTCSQAELPLQRGAKQEVDVSIPSGLPTSIFPLEFIIEAEDLTLTPDSDAANNNLPVKSGISISDNEGYSGKNTIQFVRTLTLEEYNGLTVNEGMVTFASHFKTNRSESATTVWVSNEFFIKGSASFVNRGEVTGHFYVKAADDQDCIVQINGNNLEYNYNEAGWQAYTSNKAITIERGHKIAFRTTVVNGSWNGGGKFYCYKVGSKKDARDGKFSIGGNIASMLLGDSFVTDAENYAGSWSFNDFFKNHINLTDASALIMPMLKCSDSCYKSLFEGCTSLVSAPALPATTMAKQCYRNMFMNCTSLVNAPELMAENINGNCYQRMFTGCSSLTLIKMNSKTYQSGAFISDGTTWVAGVAAEGEIWLNPAIKKSNSYQAVIPTGWTVKALPDGTAW